MSLLCSRCKPVQFVQETCTSGDKVSQCHTSQIMILYADDVLLYSADFLQGFVVTIYTWVYINHLIF